MSTDIDLGKLDKDLEDEEMRKLTMLQALQNVIDYNKARDTTLFGRKSSYDPSKRMVVSGEESQLREQSLPIAEVTPSQRTELNPTDIELLRQKHDLPRRLELYKRLGFREK
jgi:hypothetical protein